MTATNLDCNELVELITEYLEGAMVPEEQDRLEAQLAVCRGCRAYLDQMRQTIRVVGHLPSEAVTAAAQKDLLRAFRAWKAGAEPNALAP
jgi:predicted anti-sigma-YlaC factor YlaD